MTNLTDPNPDSPISSGNLHFQNGPGLDLSALSPAPKILTPKILDLPADPFAAGIIHGEKLSSEIWQAYRYYERFFKALRPELFEERLKRFDALITREDPGLATEMGAIGNGCGMSRQNILAINARTELLHATRSRECTTVYMTESGLLGQNWDWSQALEPISFIQRRSLPNGERFLSFSEPGMLGKIGLNTSGIGVCLNIVGGSEPCDGTPIHVILRRVLECSTLDEVKARLLKLEMGTMSSLLVADANNRGLLVEINGRNLRIEEVREPLQVHTNHYLHFDNPAKPVFDDTFQRFQMTEEALKRQVARDLNGMKQVLTEYTPGPVSIFSPYEADDLLGPVGTVASLAMDLKNRVMHLRLNSNQHFVEIAV